MVVKKDTNPSDRKHDFVHIAILLTIALGIGIYLIATTVMISKDGVFYIERAQQFASNPVGIIKAHPPGYPVLIFLAYKLVALFSNSSSVQTWIYSAQGVSLLCRILSLVPLYFIGKMLVGARNSFWAILILIFLPFPTRMVCDVVREWPYLLFLATGFFFLLWSAKSGKWWLFGFVGLSSGLGYLIRHESAQLVVYGFLWAVLSLFRPKLWDVSRWKTLIAIALLLIGFAIPAVPYMKCTGRIIPPKVNRIMKSFSFNALPDKTDVQKADAVSSNYNTAEIAPYNVLKALNETLRTIGENLMWFFLPVLWIGFYYHFRYEAKHEERFLITAFVLINIAMIVLRYCYIKLAVSKRWSLPLITFTIFYVPIGLQVIGNWFKSKFPMNKQKTDALKGKRVCWFLVLLLIGIGICLPKLLRPMRIEKQGYRDASQWIKANTGREDVIAVPDRRISFYAERKGLIYGKKVPKRAEYVVSIAKDGSEEPKFGRTVKEQYSVWADKRKKKSGKRLVIYKMH